MSNRELGLCGRCGFALLALAVVVLPAALILGSIETEAFVSVGVMWLVVSAAMIFGNDLTEITIWEASIKRDAKATRQAREEVEQIRDQLRKISAVSVENTYIISGELLLLVSTLLGTENAELTKSSPGMLRLGKNMNDVWKFVEPDPEQAEQARKQFRKELGM
ncbi:hypothetical protein D9N00_19190 [Pseudomonas syringae pv. actinidiae]|uniref:hypothetical protein n=1 Tax=Pseudomonas syringae TaxID=317 RepID=UPI000EF14C83|nr:hypothetical protein [Pseudomonas syringae]AYL16408.1 hypothetical protein D9N00_19190 [Pseudomonas syringae pv. actinidiae]